MIDDNENIKENFIYYLIIFLILGEFFAEKIHGFKVKDSISFIILNEDLLNKIKDV